MREPGDECPECGLTAMRRDGSCPCGWRPRGRKGGEHPDDVNQCARCDAVSKSVSLFHPDDPEAPPEDRGKRLCPSCWIGALKRRAAGQTRESHCTEPGCAKTVDEHLADFRRYGEIIMARAALR